MGSGELAILMGSVGVLFLFSILAILYFIKQVWKDRR